MTSSVSDVMLQLSSMDPAVRTAAQNMVESAQRDNFASFCLALLQELQDETKNPAARQMAGILLKNSVALDVRDEEKKKELEMRWNCLGPEVRQQIKATTIATLGCSDKTIRSTASMMIANFSRVELPHGQWPELIPTLLRACQVGETAQMEAALTALGYVCEEAGTHEALAERLEEQSEAILQAICAGMDKKDVEVMYAATHALVNSLEFMSAHMCKANVQDFLVKTVCSTVSTCSDPRVREEGMRCLVKIAELYYPLLANYIDTLFQVTTAAVQGDCEAVRLQGLLFWITVCEAEAEMDERQSSECRHYSKSGCGPLVQMALRCITQQEENQTEDMWNTSAAGAKLLQRLAEAARDAVTHPVMTFVLEKIESTNWREREGAMMAFGCILGGPDPVTIRDSVAQCSPSLLRYLHDPHPLVADTTGWVIAVVCEYFPAVFLEQPSLLNELMREVTILIVGSNDALSIRASNILYSLALSYEEDDLDHQQQTNALSKYFPQLIQALFTRIDRAETTFNNKERTVAIEALNALVDASALDCAPHVQQLIPMLLERLHSLLQQYKQNQNTSLLVMQGLFCGSLGAVLKKLGPSVASCTDQILQLLNILFQQQSNTVLDEGIMLLGNLAHANGPAFASYVPVVLPLLLQCASSYGQESLCDAAIGVIGDFAAVLGASFAPFLNSVMEQFSQTIRDPAVDRELKTSYMACCGDLALHTGAQFGAHLSGFVPLLSAVFDQSLTLLGQRSLDALDGSTHDYLLGLWETICNVNSSILQGQKANPSALLPYITSIASMAVRVACSTVSEESTCMAALLLLGDLANVAITDSRLASIVKPLVLTAGVSQVLGQMRSSAMPEIANKAHWVQSEMTKLQSA